MGEPAADSEEEGAAEMRLAEAQVTHAEAEAEAILKDALEVVRSQIPKQV